MFAKSATLQLYWQFAGTFFPLNTESQVSDVPYFSILAHLYLVTAVITNRPFPRANLPEPLIDHACDFRQVIHLTSAVLRSLIICPALQHCLSLGLLEVAQRCPRQALVDQDKGVL